MTDTRKTASVAKQIQWILLDSPRPLFLGEIVDLLPGDYPAHYVMPILIQLKRQGKIGAEKRQRDGKGPKKANAYFFKHPDDVLT